ncbi:hypothetical protein NZD89_19645 [Alicyclobacillus fastidiosus]|uniref:Uncharacterized protein n=1 Tax=Alicyclobacillus fastidiosus TaxID=392011 RepID=A0ABY6ZCC7_9BACL|nr:hypothetical protein [Alicyclobacillus fastidiosus]WAH40512.1 hypothetical protein NZD89_19645 [Alicyclobacillus fastidiosus]
MKAWRSTRWVTFGDELSCVAGDKDGRRCDNDFEGDRAVSSDSNDW